MFQQKLLQPTTIKLSSKRQFTLPKAATDIIGVNAGDTFTLQVQNGKIILGKEEDTILKVAGSLAHLVPENLKNLSDLEYKNLLIEAKKNHYKSKYSSDE